MSTLSICSPDPRMDFRCKSIRLDQIDLEDDGYRITTLQDKPPLVSSVSRLGVICPVVVKQAPDQFVIVSGFRRVAASRQSTCATIPCHILPAVTPAPVCAEIAITDNMTQRALNFVEQARCLELLMKTTGGVNPAKAAAEKIGLAFNKSLIAKLKVILAAPDIVKTGLAAGTLSLPVVLALSDFSRDDMLSLVRLFERLPMGLNKQREIVQNAREIAIREDMTVRCVLEEDRLQAILLDDALDGNQKARLIRMHLKKRRFPRIVEAEEAFSEGVRNLGLGGEVQVAPPPGFEGSTLTMTIRVNDLNSLKRAHHKLTRAIENPLVAHLFD